MLPTTWGQTGWLSENNEERRWIDERVNKTNDRLRAGQPFDISVQVTIPNEWENMAPINIGVTAGIETNKVSPVWLEKSNQMNKVITISEHSKQGFTSAAYNGTNKNTNEPVTLKMHAPIEIVGYPVKTFDSLPDLDLNLEYDFNYLAIAQWGPRKNLHNIVKWFVEENIDQEVGLVLKTSIKNNSIVDKEYTEFMMKSILDHYPDRKCKVYLLHGDMSEPELHALYSHDKIKSFVSLSHGEGFGLPIFEAAYSGLPIICPGWSGQNDFIYAPTKDKKNKKKTRLKPYFASVEFGIKPIPEDAVWEGVLEKNTMWCFPKEGSYKMRLRQVRNDYSKWKKKADYLKKWVCEEFAEERMLGKMADLIVPESISSEEVDNLFSKMLEVQT